MKLYVHIRGQIHTLQCADGRQPIRWIGSAALCRVDSSFGVTLGRPLAVVSETGAEFDMDARVSDSLKDDDHVWIVLQEDQDLCS
eukprot:ANDGO_04829.mRNA.1 hypothetical protein